MKPDSWLLVTFVCAAASTSIGCDANFGNPGGGPGGGGSVRDGSPGEGDGGECPGADAAGQLTAFRAGGAITVNGALDEPTWANARAVEFANANRSDNQVKVWMAWSDEHLHVAYSVIDARLESADDTRVFQDDGGEIYLDTAHDATPQLDANDYHFIVNIVGDIQIGNVDGGNFPVATRAIIGGYTMEIAIPWALAGGTPRPGQVMGLLLGNNDRDNGASVQFDWLDLIESGSYSRPNLWGDLRLASNLADGSCP